MIIFPSLCLNGTGFLFFEKNKHCSNYKRVNRQQKVDI